MKETTRAPRSVKLALALLLLLAAAWNIYWYAFRAKLQDDMAELRATLAANGVPLTCAEETWKGYPFRYEFTCRTLDLQGEYDGRPLQVGASRLQLVMQAYNPFHVIAILDGPTSLNGHLAAHDTARGSLLYDTHGNWDTAIEVPMLKLAGAGDATLLKLFARVKDGRLQFAANADDIKIANPAAPALNHAEIVAETDAALLASPDPLREAANSATQLAITRLKADLPSISVAATGSLSLDKDRKLNGKLASEVSDLDAALALLAPRLKLSDQEVAAAKAVIGLIGGGGKTQKIDVIAKAGELYFGPFKVADVPPIE